MTAPLHRPLIAASLEARAIARARRVAMYQSMPSEPEPPAIVPPGQPFIQPGAPPSPGELPPYPVDPGKPWIEPNRPGESPVLPDEPELPFAEPPRSEF